MDFDDTLYIHDKVNIRMISFLYQCANQNIPVILITKHSKDIHESLKKLKISEELFFDIIQLEQMEDKCRYIKGKDSILIDDSFAERKRVRERLGIPVFDIDMVESLIDWRM